MRAYPRTRVRGWSSSSRSMRASRASKGMGRPSPRGRRGSQDHRTDGPRPTGYFEPPPRRAATAVTQRPPPGAPSAGHWRRHTGPQARRAAPQALLSAAVQTSGGRGTAVAQHVYIGSFTSGGGRGLTTATADPRTGALTALGATADVANPSFLAASPDGATLYTVSETEPD